ncbi:hypothetical protein [Flavihumibacter profundi]|uniref:hypothetical protein n=1 Tax=Flavihumibacter profundi TaxID=2716883 RepID=UPI001CC7AAFD|nr:hypothetical protein [Flavihumibacter profundi]MBZ5855613.1 hypothetical protein [Flavihumibacter profundi]
MKLFIITCLKEYQEDVQKIFKKALINAFSVTDVIGFKDNNLHPNPLGEWFASGDEKFDSVMIFSFTTEENAENGLELIRIYNETNNSGFPVRAFLVPVEKSL